MTTRRHPTVALVYHVLLGAASGAALGFFGWMVADRWGDSAQPMWPYLAGGIVIMTIVVRAMATRSAGRRWVHVLWIPVILFVALMTMVVLALRNFT